MNMQRNQPRKLTKNPITNMRDKMDKAIKLAKSQIDKLMGKLLRIDKKRDKKCEEAEKVAKKVPTSHKTQQKHTSKAKNSKKKHR